MKLFELGDMPRIGIKGVYERTDPDYEDHRIAKLVRDYQECPNDWKECFLNGLPNHDIETLKDRGIIKHRL